MGQMISQFGNLVPPAYNEQFDSMCMQAPRSSFPDVKQILLEDLNIQDLSEFFTSFDETPIASASLAQVHMATLKSG